MVSYFRSSKQNKLTLKRQVNPLYAELNPICHLLALLAAHRILHVSRIRVKSHLQFASIIRSFNVYESVHRKYIPVYIQQDAMLHSLFISACMYAYATHSKLKPVPTLPR